MAGTLGVGNIYGVALGIIIGGEGTVFWLFISAFFSLVIKYSENVLARAMSKNGFGMMSVLENTFKRKYVAKGYAVLTGLIALTMGSFIQADSFISSVEQLVDLPKIYIAVCLFLITAIVTFGGAEKIKSVTEIIVPVASAVFILIAVIGIFKNATRLPNVFSNIFRSAFNPNSMLFGVLPGIGTLVFTEGFARGILSNEAGVGTSALANSDGERTPCTAGLFGMCEIVFDTLILCMLTAFLILTAVPNLEDYTSPMRLVFDAVSYGAGGFFSPLLLISIFFFAFSTMVCWFFYGQKSLIYLIGNKGYITFPFLFYLAIICASFLDTYLIIKLNDVLIFLMSIPTLLSIVINSSIIKKTTENEELL